MGCPRHPNAPTESRAWYEGSGKNRRSKVTNTCECGDMYEGSDLPAPEPEGQTDN